jgi:hypothetical protein
MWWVTTFLEDALLFSLEFYFLLSAGILTVFFGGGWIIRETNVDAYGNKGGLGIVGSGILAFSCALLFAALVCAAIVLVGAFTELVFGLPLALGF